MKQITRIRKEVTTIANRINGKLHDLSAAFRRAWQIVRWRLLVAKVTGVTFGNRQRTLRKLETYNKGMVNVTLERDTDNNHDKNAVKVMVSVSGGIGYHLGYVPRDLAELITPLIDKGIKLAARLHGVTGGYEGHDTYGALITIEM